MVKEIIEKTLEDGTKEVRVSYQRMTPGQERADVGDDTMVPQNDKTNLHRRKALKRFRAFIDQT